MGLKKIIYLILIEILITSCFGGVKKDDELTFKREQYNGTELRLDGYYYDEYYEDFISIIFFYRNGIIQSGGGTKIEEVEILESYFSTSEFLNNRYKNKQGWGVFIVSENKISFERWYPSDGPIRSAIREGFILNDTTFVINKLISSSGEEMDKNEIYHFKKFEHKPDSITQFIE